MSEVNTGGEAAHEEAVKKATALGWTPKENFRGDPAKFREAEEFLDFGDRLNPILRENNRKLEAQLAARDREIDKIRNTVAEFAKLHEQTAKEAYEKAYTALKLEKQTALENQDFGLVVELDEKLAATRAAEAKPVPTVAAPASAPQYAPEVVETHNVFLRENQWADPASTHFDEELEAYARVQAELLVKHNEPSLGANFKPFLDKVAAKVKERYPDKFDKSPRERVAAVEGGGQSGGKPRAKSYESLPKEAQEACALLVSTIPGYTREKYLANYKV